MIEMTETMHKSPNPFPNRVYKCILIDPPWEQPLMNNFKHHSASEKLPYPTMSLQEIKEIPIQSISDIDTHLWLWATNHFLHDAFHVIDAWGFKYLNDIVWVKPSGVGAWFVNTTQHLLFAYNKKCVFNKEKYKPTHLMTGLPKYHSEKPVEFYSLIESISDNPKIEIFARDRRQGWDAWGNEVPKYCQKLII